MAYVGHDTAIAAPAAADILSSSVTAVHKGEKAILHHEEEEEEGDVEVVQVEEEKEEDTDCVAIDVHRASKCHMFYEEEEEEEEGRAGNADVVLGRSESTMLNMDREEEIEEDREEHDEEKEEDDNNNNKEGRANRNNVSILSQYENNTTSISCVFDRSERFSLEEVREILLLPRAQVLRIVKAALPEDIRVDKRAVQSFSRLISLFLLALSDAAVASTISNTRKNKRKSYNRSSNSNSSSSNSNSKEKKKMLTPQHVLAGLRSLGFEDIAAEIEKFAAADAVTEEETAAREKEDQEEEEREEADTFTVAEGERENAGIEEKEKEERREKNWRSAEDNRANNAAETEDKEEGREEDIEIDRGIEVDDVGNSAAAGIVCSYNYRNRENKGQTDSVSTEEDIDNNVSGEEVNIELQQHESGKFCRAAYPYINVSGAAAAATEKTEREKEETCERKEEQEGEVLFIAEKEQKEQYERGGGKEDLLQGKEREKEKYERREEEEQQQQQEEEMSEADDFFEAAMQVIDEEFQNVPR